MNRQNCLSNPMSALGRERTVVLKRSKWLLSTWKRMLGWVAELRPVTPATAAFDAGVSLASSQGSDRVKCPLLALVMWRN